MCVRRVDRGILDRAQLDGSNWCVEHIRVAVDLRVGRLGCLFCAVHSAVEVSLSLSLSSLLLSLARCHVHSSPVASRAARRWRMAEDFGW